MREIRTSGSVRGGDGNIPTYSAFGPAQWGEIRRERLRVGESGVIAEELQAVGLVCGEQPLQEQPSEQAREHAHRQKETRSTGYPTLAVERDATARHDHVDVRVMAPTPTIP